MVSRKVKGMVLQRDKNRGTRYKGTYVPDHTHLEHYKREKYIFFYKLRPQEH